MAACSDPGYVPLDIKSYEKTMLPQREQLLWNYLVQIGLNPAAVDDTNRETANEFMLVDVRESHELLNSNV